MEQTEKTTQDPQNPIEDTREVEVKQKSATLRSPRNELRRVSSYERLKDQISLPDVLNEPLGRKAFRDFLTQEFSVENLNFWEGLEDIQMNFPEDSEEHTNELMKLYQKFICEGSPEELNIPFTIKKPIIDAVESGKLTKETFKEVREYCFSLMSLDSFKRFVNEPQSDFAVQYALKRKRRSSSGSNLRDFTSTFFDSRESLQSSTGNLPLSQQPKKALDMLGVDPSKEKVKKFLGMNDQDLKKQQQDNLLREEERIRHQRRNLDVINRRQNMKALGLLGHDPSEKKLESVLGELPTPEEIERDMKRQAEIQEKEEKKLQKKNAKERKKKNRKKKGVASGEEDVNAKSDGSVKSGSEDYQFSDGSVKSGSSVKSDEEGVKSDTSVKSDSAKHPDSSNEAKD